MSIDLTSMSRKELEKLRSDVEKAIRKISKDELKAAKKAAEEAAAKFGFSLSEVTGGVANGGAKAASAPKYANPDDPDQTWSGRGRQPQWYKDALSAGKSPEEMAL